MTNENYEKQVKLLLDVLPHVAKEPCFALKGGTAINLFLLDMPRLSVDIDLTYLPIEPRDVSLIHLTQALERIGASILRAHPNYQVHYHRTTREKRLTKLFIQNQDARITVEPNEILRGSVFPTQHANLCPSAEIKFQSSVTNVALLSPADLYAGKICAALDRQHARDLFDVKLLFENGGITDEIRQAFVIYLASCSRPMHELLNPNQLDITASFEKEFAGMSGINVTYNELIDVRQKLISEINQSLTHRERLFLLSLKQAAPEWELLNLAKIDSLPALKWKIFNIQRMEHSKKEALFHKLKEVLQV